MLEMGILIAVLVGISQIFKSSGVPVKYIPAINLVLGIASGFLFSDLSVAEQVITGAIIGLSASGLYDQTKLVTKK